MIVSQKQAEAQRDGCGRRRQCFGPCVYTKRADKLAALSRARFHADGSLFTMW